MHIYSLEIETKNEMNDNVAPLLPAAPCDSDQDTFYALILQTVLSAWLSPGGCIEAFSRVLSSSWGVADHSKNFGIL